MLIESDEQIEKLLHRIHCIAILGIKTEAQADQPAFYVADYLVRAGFEVVPVPVYYPDIQTILGKPVYRRLSDVPGPIDLVNVFRRPQDIPAHLDDILQKKPAAVWFQLGISHPQVAQRLADNGIVVVQNRCILVEHQKLLRCSV